MVVISAIIASLNGIAVGLNVGALLFLERDEKWFLWYGIFVCGALMVYWIRQAAKHQPGH